MIFAKSFSCITLNLLSNKRIEYEIELQNRFYDCFIVFFT